MKPVVDLEELLVAAVAKGLTHFTLYPVESEDRKTIYWAARATPSTGHSYVQIQDTDPVAAMVQVLQALPQAKKRAATKKDRGVADLSSATDAEEITATVNAATGLDPDLESEIDKWLPKT